MMQVLFIYLLLRNDGVVTALAPIGGRIIGVETVEEHDGDHQHQVDDQTDVPQHVLPRLPLEIAHDRNTNEEACRK